MKKDIVASIIKGKKITGDDIGRLLLADMAEEFIHFKGTNELKSIISQDEFNKLLNSLPNDTQIKRYNNYVNLHNTIRTYYGLHQYALKSAEYRLNIFTQILNNLTGAIERQIQEDNTPLIMTEKQYNKAMEQYTDDLNSEPYNYFDIFFHVINIEVGIYRTNYHDRPDMNPPDKEVEALIKKYSKEKVKNKELRDLYYKTYYPTGVDGDFRFKDFWEVGKTRKEFLHELAIRDIKPIKEKVEAYKAKDLEKAVDECFIYDVLTKEQIDQHLNYTLYDTPPEDVYKEDIMEGEIITDNFNISTDDKDEQKEIIRLYKLYADELPELVDLIKTRFKKYKCLKVFNDMNIKDSFTTGVYWEDLVKDNVPDYRSWALYNFREDYKQAENGIAILKEDILGKYEKHDIIDEQGNYIDRSKDLTYLNNIQDAYKQVFYEGEKLNGETINQNIQQSFYTNLTMVNAHNTFIDIVADMVNLPSLKEAFTFDLYTIKQEAEVFNRQLKMLLTFHIGSYARGGRFDEAKQLRDNIFNIMPYIDLSKAEITDSNRAKAEDFIHDLNNFKGISATSQPLYILTGES